MNKRFASDVYRYFGYTKIPVLHRLSLTPELKYLRLLRAAQDSKGIWRLFRRFRVLRMKRKTHIQIPIETRIGRGFYIGHFGRIIINPMTIIGDNVNISTGVTIGQTNHGSRKGVPIIGSMVWIGTNSVIVGAIKIGNDVLIAPNSFVNMDVPDHSVVIGNPATITHRVFATEGYLQNIVGDEMQYLDFNLKLP